ncbi:MAG: PP2C family protein-serine/threonine phosphatase [bacterium]
MYNFTYRKSKLLLMLINVFHVKHIKHVKNYISINIPDKLSIWITGNPNIQTLENRFYNILIFFAFIFSVISTIFNIYNKFNYYIIISSSIASLTFAFLFYRSRIKSLYYPWLHAILILLFLSAVWITNGGSIGSAPYIYVIALLSFVIISRRKDHAWMIIITLANVGALFAFEHYTGYEYIIPYADKHAYAKDIAFVFICLLIGIFFLVRFVKNNYDDERTKVLEQKDVIKKQNDEVISSINYAAYIQGILFPDLKKMPHLVSEYFVIFRPKAIVSGDFYWFKEKGDYGLIIVADCTGHGVPAAFLGILGLSILEEMSLKTEDEISASDFLEELRIKMAYHLTKENDKSMPFFEGMAIGLCVINYPRNIMEFAGASHSLFLLRNNHDFIEPPYTNKDIKGQRTLYTFRGISNTIGHNPNKKRFTSYFLNIEPGDTFYMMSDGYIDQFNDNFSCKFKMKNFRDLILDMKNIPLSSQKNILEDAHEKWKGKMPQIDDILAFGFRL